MKNALTTSNLTLNEAEDEMITRWSLRLVTLQTLAKFRQLFTRAVHYSRLWPNVNGPLA